MENSLTSVIGSACSALLIWSFVCMGLLVTGGCSAVPVSVMFRNVMWVWLNTGNYWVIFNLLWSSKRVGTSFCSYERLSCTPVWHLLCIDDLVFEVTTSVYSALHGSREFSFEPDSSCIPADSSYTCCVGWVFYGSFIIQSGALGDFAELPDWKKVRS